MSMHENGSKRSEICKNNDVAPPPKVNFTLPKLKDIGKNTVDWLFIKETELPTDLMLLTAIDTEFLSCYVLLKNPKRSFCHGLGYVYFGEFGDGKVKVALKRCDKGSVGANSSLIVVKNTVEMLKPKAVVCVGCCGMINPAKAKLGDVVISTKLATYSETKITKDGTQENRGIKANVSKNMGDIIPSAADAWEPPLEEGCSFTVEVHRQSVMLSGGELVNNLEKRQQLLKDFPDAIAVEMEGQGLYTAAYNLGIEWAVVKGISDFADGSKTATGNWQPFASAMAASVVYNMFRYPDVLQHWPHYQTRVPVPAVVPNPDPGPRIPIQELLRSIADTKEGKVMYNGRMFEYSVSGRVHSVQEPWVLDATAKDLESKVTVTKKHYKTSAEALSEAIQELVKQLQEKQIMN